MRPTTLSLWGTKQFQDRKHCKKGSKVVVVFRVFLMLVELYGNRANIEPVFANFFVAFQQMYCTSKSIFALR